jgi:poly(hydroxyalkanoate) depolymerase family esterase
MNHRVVQSRASVHARFATAFARRVGIPAVLALGLLRTSPARAASLSGPITGWASGVPSYISMYEYVPANLAANPPILVVSHYCGGNASGVFGEAQGGGIVAAADKYGFIMIFPQTSNNCWDVGSTKSLTHDGGGDTQAIAQMVSYALTKHNANPNRVYAAGTSSGAMMTEALLAVYPDVFKAGAEFSGVPAGCWSVNYSASNQWSGPCAGGQVSHTGQEWGTMVHGMDMSYSGHRPRVQLWHGMSDSTINFNNQTEAIKEWINVLGLSTNPTANVMVSFNNHQWTHQSWQDACGYTVLDAWSEQNGPHGTDANLNATYVIPFLGLDKAGATDPEVAQCSGNGGAGGNGSGGSGGTIGNTGGGGVGGASGGTVAGGGTASANGGTSGSGMVSGGTTNSVAGGTSNGAGGQSASAGSSATNGGSLAAAGSEAQPGPSSSGGCSYHFGRPAGSRGAFALGGLLALGAALGRRRRSKLQVNDRRS